MLDVLLLHVTRVGHNLCNPHHWTPGRFKIVLMHRHTCKSLLNTLGRAVEQLAGCLAKQARSHMSQQSRSKYMTVSKRVFPYSRPWDQVTPIAPPTGCGIRPVPNKPHRKVSCDRCCSLPESRAAAPSTSPWESK